MTPMIDCIMLLLIFFMTTSKMTAQGAVPVPEARHGGVIDPRKAIVISLFEGKAGKDTEVVLGDGKPDDEKRPVAKNEQEIREYIRKLHTDPSQPRTQVVVKGEERVPNRDMHRISRIVGEFDKMELFLGVKDAEKK
jgi:biopolymer transport protein ExbD